MYNRHNLLGRIAPDFRRVEKTPQDRLQSPRLPGTLEIQEGYGDANTRHKKQVRAEEFQSCTPLGGAGFLRPLRKNINHQSSGLKTRRKRAEKPPQQSFDAKNSCR